VEVDAMLGRFAAFVVISIVVSLTLAAPPAAAKEDPVYTGTFTSLAVGGHAPVAYFTQGKPVEGRSEHELAWNGATWRFSTAENLAAFEADPDAYAPQYGGYCAWAVSQGYTASTDPTAWNIVDDKLYLNYSHAIKRRWEQDIPGNIAKADANWPAVLN
jgi:YHS domain-containing protein